MVLSGAGADQLSVPVLLLCADHQLHPHTLRDPEGLLADAGQVHHHKLPQRAYGRQHPCGKRHPQQPAGVCLLGSAQRLLLGADGLRHLCL